MVESVFLALVSTLATVLVAIVSWLVYRDTHRNTVQTEDDARIKAIVEAALQPLTQQVHDLSRELATVADRQQQLQRDERELTERIGRILDRVTVVETKIEVFWKSVAMDAAKIIHSPDPRRQEVDKLIEAFQDAVDGRGTMTVEQYGKLRAILNKMRDWEPGVKSDFPIYPGEQFAAAVLLRTMDHALESSTKGRRSNVH